MLEQERGLFLCLPGVSHPYNAQDGKLEDMLRMLFFIQCLAEYEANQLNVRYLLFVPYVISVKSRHF